MIPDDEMYQHQLLPILVATAMSVDGNIRALQPHEEGIVCLNDAQLQSAQEALLQHLKTTESVWRQRVTSNTGADSHRVALAEKFLDVKLEILVQAVDFLQAQVGIPLSA